MLAKEMPEADRTALWNSYGTYPMATVSPKGWTPLQSEVDKYYERKNYAPPSYIVSNPLAIKAQDNNARADIGVSATTAKNAMNNTLAFDSAFTPPSSGDPTGTGERPLPFYLIIIGALVALFLLLRR